MTSLRISTDIVSQITLASRAALEIPLDSDEDVHETIGLEVDLNLLFRDFPMQRTGSRIMPLSIPQIAKDNLNKAFLSSAETPGSTVPHGSMSGWKTHRLDGDQLDPEKVFLPSNLSQVTFEEVFSDQILEMSAALDSSNVRVKQGVVAEWLDTVDKPIQGNVDQDEAYYKNFLHAFANSEQLDDLLRSSVALSLSDAPQPNRMEGGGTDPSDESIAQTQDSLENRTDFKNGKVFPTQTSEALQRWTSFLKLRQGDSWMFKLQLSIHDSEFKTSESRLYRFILRQKDAFPQHISMAEHQGGVHPPNQARVFTISKPQEVPNSLGTDYTGSLAYMGIDIASEGVRKERCVNTNSMFHTGKALSLDQVVSDTLKAEELEDGFVCALVPANPLQVQGLSAPIFAVAHACIKKKGEVGVITQLHPIKDMTAQLDRYLESDKCLVIPAVDWMDMKNEADDVRRPEKLFQRGESKTYPTCHVRVHAGSGVEFKLHFEEDSKAADDPNADLTLAPAARLTHVELTSPGSEYQGTFAQHEAIPSEDDHKQYYGRLLYRWTLRGTNGEYDHAGSGEGTVPFWDFMNRHFYANADGLMTPFGGVNKVEYAADTYEPILAHDPHEMKVLLEQSRFACSIETMSDSMRVPLFHNQDVQGSGTVDAINGSSCSILSHPFQNHQGSGTNMVVNQPIQQNQAQDVEVQWPPEGSIDHPPGSLSTLNMEGSRALLHAGLQYSTAAPYVETGGFGERGNYHDVVGDPSDLALATHGVNSEEGASMKLKYDYLMENHVKVADMTIHQRYRHDSKLQLVHGFEEQWFLERDATVNWNEYGLLDNVNWAEDYGANNILDNSGTEASEVVALSRFTTGASGTFPENPSGTAELKECLDILPLEVQADSTTGRLLEYAEPIPWSDIADTNESILDSFDGASIADPANIAVGSTFTTSSEQTAATGTATLREYTLIDPAHVTSVGETGLLMDMELPEQPYRLTNTTDAEVTYTITIDATNVSKIQIEAAADGLDPVFDYDSPGEIIDVPLGPGRSIVFYITEGDSDLDGAIHVLGAEVQIADLQSSTRYQVLHVGNPYSLTNTNDETVTYNIRNPGGNLQKFTVGGVESVFTGDSHYVQLASQQSIQFFVPPESELDAKIMITFGDTIQIADIEGEKRYQVVSVGSSLGAQAGMRFTANEGSAPALENQNYANYNGTAFVRREVVYSKVNIQQTPDTTDSLQVVFNGSPVADMKITNGSQKDIQYKIDVAESSTGLYLVLLGDVSSENDIHLTDATHTLTLAPGQTYLIKGVYEGILDSGIKVTQLNVLNSEITIDVVQGATVTYIIEELEPASLKEGATDSIGATADTQWLAPVTATNIEVYPSSNLDDHTSWPKFRKIVTKQKAFDVVKKSYALDSDDDQPVLDSAAVIRFSVGKPGEDPTDIQIQIRVHDDDLQNLGFQEEHPERETDASTKVVTIDINFDVQAGGTLENGDAEFIVEGLSVVEYVGSRIPVVFEGLGGEEGLITVTPGSTERGGITLLELSEGYRFTKSPVGLDAAGDQDSLPLRIEGDHSPADQLYATDAVATRMECWPFASQGVRFELKKGRVALAEDADESQLPRLSLHDQNTLVRVELAELDPTGGGSIVVPMNMGISGEFTVDLQALRDALFGEDPSRLIYRDYTVRVHLMHPVFVEGSSVLELDASEIQVDNEAKQITYKIDFKTNNAKLASGDNSELTTQHVIAALAQVASDGNCQLKIDGGDATPTPPVLSYVPSDASQETILSDTNFLEAPEGNLFTYSGGVDLEYRWYDDLPFQKLKEAASEFEISGIPFPYTLQMQKLTEGIGGFRKSLVSLKAGLQEHLGASSAAHFRFYGEVGAFPNMDYVAFMEYLQANEGVVHPLNHETLLKNLEDSRDALEFSIELNDNDVPMAIRLYLADRNFTMAEKVTPIGLGRFVNVNHSGGLLPFEEAQDGLHKDNFPRDFIVRACHVLRRQSQGVFPTLEEDLQIEYNRDYLTSAGQNTTPSTLKCYPLVCNGDQARIAQIKLVGQGS